METVPSPPVIPLIRNLFLNPSNQAECRSVPQSWKIKGFVIGFFMLMVLVIAFIWACWEGWIQLSCRVHWGQHGAAEKLIP